MRRIRSFTSERLAEEGQISRTDLITTILRCHLAATEITDKRIDAQDGECLTGRRAPRSGCEHYFCLTSPWNARLPGRQAARSAAPLRNRHHLSRGRHRRRLAAEIRLVLAATSQ